MAVIKKPLPALDTLKSVHIIGVGGTLMGAFASFLKRRGLEVSGSDQNVYPPMSDVLQQAGIKLMNGYRVENLTGAAQRPDLVVIGNVIRADNPEAQAAIDGGFTYASLPETMEHLLLTQTRNLVVAGTHGKTTTSSLLAYVLSQCQKDPSYFIGGVSQDLPFSFYVADPSQEAPVGRPYFVLEGDEYDTAFWDKVPKFNHYLPDDVILTSVEFDHADIYKDLKAVVLAFEGLVGRIRPGGRLICCSDYSTVLEVSKCTPGSSVSKFTYGTRSPAQFIAQNSRVKDGLTSFDVIHAGNKLEELVIQGSGTHNVLNSLAVWIECRELGLDLVKVKEALRSFRGVKRRQEVRGEVRGVMVIDDFAHHPTAVRETLRGLKAKYAGRRLLTVFEPRSATSRRKVFQQEYAKAFQEADLIWIASPYDQTRIAAEDQFSSEVLVGDLNRAGKSAQVMPTVAEGVREIAKTAKAGDLIAVLSNGGFDGLIPKLLVALDSK